MGPFKSVDIAYTHSLHKFSLIYRYLLELIHGTMGIFFNNRLIYLLFYPHDQRIPGLEMTSCNEAMAKCDGDCLS